VEKVDCVVKVNQLRKYKKVRKSKKKIRKVRKKYKKVQKSRGDSFSKVGSPFPYFYFFFKKSVKKGEKVNHVFC
jgi:hypothetical protein